MVNLNKGEGIFPHEFEDVLGAVKEWKPKRRYEHETKYRDDLFAHLRKKLREEKSRWKKKAKIKKESGEGRRDIAVDERFAVEIKKDLKKKHFDRLRGQLGRYEEKYEDRIIIVVCGVKDEEAWDKLEDKFQKKRLGGILKGPRVIPVRKNV